MPEQEVNAAIETRCGYCEFPDNISDNPVAYENPEKSINIAGDDGDVKKQEESRKGGKKTERGKRNHIHNTMPHIDKSGLSYT